ncbi:MAG: zinc-ribbon domain-containing protein [Acutalibacteraceae bacterium]
MKFCQNCGKEVLDEAVICPNCGCSVQADNNTQSTEVDESVSAGLVVLSVLIPLFGIIYWPVKAKTRPKCAKTCGIAAIISWAVYFVFMMVTGGM